MELHAHSHTDRKKWTHYFWEFLMLFLAVFCGFLAEYQLEHVIEHNRAKEYAASMANDLAADTSELKGYKRYMNYAANNVDTLLHLLSGTDPKDIPTGKLYYYGLCGGAPRSFVPKDATMQQMKGSGSLRYFTNKSINEKVARYDQLSRLMRTNDEHDITIYSEVRKIRAQIFIFRYNNAANDIFQGYWQTLDRSMVDSFTLTNPPVLTYDKILFNQYAELVRSRFLRRKLVAADTLLQHASVLLGELKKEYHLK
jgi:hypothetical protein